MPLLMSLEGPKLGAIDEIRARFYANLPQSIFKGKFAVGPTPAEPLNGLGAVFPAMPSFSASLGDNKLLVLFAIGMGMWFAASARGQRLVGISSVRKADSQMPRVDVTKNWIRHRQISPKACAPGSFRTIKRGKRKRVAIVVCCPKGQWKRGRCQVGMKTQSVLKSR